MSTKLYLKLWNLRQTLRRDEEGVTAVEYGLLVAVIALVMVVGAILLGDAISELFSDAADEVSGT